MAALRFTTTRLSGLRAAGRLQEMQHATVALFLERELGPPFGRLFADFEAESSDIRAWYTDALVPPVALASLPAGEAEAVSQRVAEMIGQIGAFAERIAGESTQKANLARILSAATTFPIEDIWVDGTQPVIVNWGFHRHDVEAGVPRPIRERFRRTETAQADASSPAATEAFAAAAAPPPAEPAARRWLRTRRWFVLPVIFWLVFVALVAASYELLLPACGLVGPLGLAQRGSCPMSADAARVFTDGADLQALVEGAELEMAQRRRFCVIPHHAGLPAKGAGTVVVDNRL